MNGWIQWFNATSSTWADRFWMATWQAILVIAIAWLLTTLLYRLSPRVRSWIWRLAYVKIVLSLFWTTPIELALLPPVPAPQKQLTSRVGQRPEAPRVSSQVSGVGNQDAGGAASELDGGGAKQEPELAKNGDGVVAGASSVARPESAMGVDAIEPNSTTPFVEPQGVPPESSYNVADRAGSVAATGSPAPAITWQTYLAGVWLLGLVFVVAWLALDSLRAWKLLRRSKPLNDQRWQSLSESVCRQLGLRRGIRLRSSSAARSPVLIRFVRPAIILPETMLDSASILPAKFNLPFSPSPSTGEGRGEGDERENTSQTDIADRSQCRVPTSALGTSDLALAIAHEAAHLRRHDLAWNALAAIVHVALYFHPLVWFAHRRIRLEQEMACDEMVLQKLSAAPHDYGRMLVNVVRNVAPGVVIALK